MLEHQLYKEDMIQINHIQIPWNKINGKTILITGGSGLIGSTLVDALIFRNEMQQANINIWILGRYEKTILDRFGKYLDKQYFHYLKQDVSEKINVDSSIDYIIHGASKGDPYSFVHDPVGVMNANYIGMYQVLELAREKRVEKVLFISSGEVYGIKTKENETTVFSEKIGLKESEYGYVDILSPRSCYASSKRAAETLCESYKIQYDVNISIARPCHTYGAAMLDSDNRVIGEFIRKAIKHSDIVMKSNGIQKRSYCYVSDTVSALLHILLLGDNGEAYNIANSNSIITIKELAELIAQKVEMKVIFEIPEEIEKKGYSDIVNAVLDASELEGLGWNPKYGILEGIERTMEILLQK